MLEGRFLKFRCDYCSAIAETKDGGLPPGFMYLESNILKGRGIRHICGSCLAEKRQGEEKPIRGGQTRPDKEAKS